MNYFGNPFGFEIHCDGNLNVHYSMTVIRNGNSVSVDSKTLSSPTGDLATGIQRPMRDLSKSDNDVLIKNVYPQLESGDLVKAESGVINMILSQ
jgi:hypothetical protein